MAKHLFNKEEQDQITRAIQEAEKNTSGEIMVHIEQRCKEDVLDRAAGVFDMLKMNQTELRNGVLFYLAVKDHRFAILGDAGINEKTGDHFWTDIKDMMQEHFRAGKFAAGLEKGIIKAGEKLKEHFPYQADDKNELSDEISFGQ